MVLCSGPWFTLLLQAATSTRQWSRHTTHGTTTALPSVCCMLCAVCCVSLPPQQATRTVRESVLPCARSKICAARSVPVGVAVVNTVAAATHHPRRLCTGFPPGPAPDLPATTPEDATAAGADVEDDDTMAATVALPRVDGATPLESAEAYAAAAAAAAAGPTSGGSDLDSACSDPPFFAVNQTDCVPLWEGPPTSRSYSSSKSSGLSGLVPPLLLQRVRRLSPRLSPRAPSGSTSSYPSRLPRPRSGSYRSNGPLSRGPSGPISLRSSDPLSARSMRAPSSFGEHAGPSALLDTLGSSFSYGGGGGAAVVITPRSSEPSSLSSNASSGLFKVGPRHVWLPPPSAGMPGAVVVQIPVEEARIWVSQGRRRSGRRALQLSLCPP